MKDYQTVFKTAIAQKKIQGDFHYRTNVVEDRLSWVELMLDK